MTQENQNQKTNSPTNNTKNLIALMLLFLFLVVGFVSIYLIETKRKREQMANTNTNTSLTNTNIAATNTPTNDETKTTTEPSRNLPTTEAELDSDLDTSSWLTYRNEEWGFELKYPEGWCVNSCEEKNFEDIHIRLISYDNLPDKISEEELLIEVDLESLELNSDEKIDEIKIPGISTKKDFEYNYQKFFKEENLVSIGDLKILQIYQYDVSSDSFSKNISFFSFPRHYAEIYINFNIYKRSRSPEIIAEIIRELEDNQIDLLELKIFDQVISTLKKI